MDIKCFLFINKVKLWMCFNDKERALPVSSSKNTTFYIASMVVNMESIIVNYIDQMKKLIKYLGKQNVII